VAGLVGLSTCVACRLWPKTHPKASGIAAGSPTATQTTALHLSSGTVTSEIGFRLLHYSLFHCLGNRFRASWRLYHA
jgi:hypothetical protein